MNKSACTFTSTHQKVFLSGVHKNCDFVGLCDIQLYNIHPSAITIKQVRGEGNNINFLVTLGPVMGWDILAASEKSVLKVNVLETGKMDKCNDLSDFDKGQTVMRSEQQVHLEFSQYAVVSTKCSKEEQPVNQWQGHGWLKLTDACGEWMLACLVRSHRRATLAQTAKNVNAEHTGYSSLLCMRMCSCRLVRVPMLTPDHHLQCAY